jgi:hypothetical protein
MHFRDVIPTPVLSFITWIASTMLASALFWITFGSCVAGGCIDAPLPDREPQARLVTSWDPLACGSPHRVAIEIEDDDGRMLSTSAPCELGEMTIDVPAWGIYRGRIYAWSIAGNEATISSLLPVRHEIDEPVVQWNVQTPR